MGNKIIETNVDILVFDDKNANKHTEYGMRLLENSIQKFGLGRSILLDKNNRIIAGNGVVETASQVGLEDVIVVETSGNKIVAVKRTDIDLDTAKGRELALADNATGKANLAWDDAVIAELSDQYNIDVEDWGIPTFVEDDEDDQPDDDDKEEIPVHLIVRCNDVAKLPLLFSELQDRGFVCELKE